MTDPTSPPGLLAPLAPVALALDGEPIDTGLFELFKRLPDRLFSPLASENRHRFWSVLCALYKHRWIF